MSLRVFVATIEEQSLTAAAMREGIAVSAVSRRIAELEGRTGITLLERHERGVHPTPAGRELMEQLYRVFASFDAIAAGIEDLRGGRSGHVRVVSHMTALSAGLAGRVADFVKGHPGIEVEIEECTSQQAAHAVQTGMADVGLISGTLPPDGLDVTPWLDDELVALLPEGHPLAAMESLSFDDLVGEPFVGMQRDSALQQLFRHQAKLLGTPLHERFHATSFDTVRRMVASGLGVGILPRSAAQAGPCANTEQRSLNEQWARRSLMLCTRDRATASPAARRFVEHMLGEGLRKAALPKRKSTSGGFGPEPENIDQAR